MPNHILASITRYDEYSNTIAQQIAGLLENGQVDLFLEGMMRFLALEPGLKCPSRCNRTARKTAQSGSKQRCNCLAKSRI
jgi:hypothetical protein